MRLNDRVIREELRRAAYSVPIPDDLWAKISRQLDRDAARARAGMRRRHVRMGLRLRQLLVAGAAAAAFWMILIPLGARADWIQTPAPASAAWLTDTPWDVPTEAHRKYRSLPRASQGGVDGPGSGVEVDISL